MPVMLLNGSGAFMGGRSSCLFFPRRLARRRIARDIGGRVLDFRENRDFSKAGRVEMDVRAREFRGEILRVSG